MRFVAGAFCFTLAMVIAAVEALSDDDLDFELAQTSPIQSPREVQGQAASSTGSSGVKPCEELPQTASSSSGVKRTFSGRPTSNQTLSVHQVRSKIVRTVQSVCNCSRQSSKRARPSCFAKFAHVIDDVVKLRIKVHSLHKLDSDVFVSCLLVNILFWVVVLSHSPFLSAPVSALIDSFATRSLPHVNLGHEHVWPSSRERRPLAGSAWAITLQRRVLQTAGSGARTLSKTEAGIQNWACND